MSVNPASTINAVHSSDVRNVAFAIVRSMNPINAAGGGVLIHDPSVSPTYPLRSRYSHVRAHRLLRVIEKRSDGLTDDDVEEAMLGR